MVNDVVIEPSDDSKQDNSAEEPDSNSEKEKCLKRKATNDYDDETSLETASSLQNSSIFDAFEEAGQLNDTCKDNLDSDTASNIIDNISEESAGSTKRKSGRASLNKSAKKLDSEASSSAIDNISEESAVSILRKSGRVSLKKSAKTFLTEKLSTLKRKKKESESSVVDSDVIDMSVEVKKMPKACVEDCKPGAFSFPVIVYVLPEHVTP